MIDALILEVQVAADVEKLASIIDEINQRDNENYSGYLVAQELIARRDEWDSCVSSNCAMNALVVMRAMIRGHCTKEALQYAADRLEQELVVHNGSSNRG